MTGRVKRLLYLVHGAPSYYQEAAYSMLSLWRQISRADMALQASTQ